MNGVFVTQYDGPRPVAFSAAPNSYAGKLLAAYRIMGGVPERDMLLRTSDQPVFKTKGTPPTQTQTGADGGFSDVYSNGRRERGGQRFDRDLGIRVENLKSWQLEAIKAKRERLEFKIKRALDYSDQLQREISQIDRLLSNLTDLGSFDAQLLEIENQISVPGAANVVDNREDVHGLAIGRPGDLTFADALEKAEEEDQRVS